MATNETPRRSGALLVAPSTATYDPVESAVAMLVHTPLRFERLMVWWKRARRHGDKHRRHHRHLLGRHGSPRPRHGRESPRRDGDAADHPTFCTHDLGNGRSPARDRRVASLEARPIAIAALTRAADVAGAFLCAGR